MRNMCSVPGSSHENRMKSDVAFNDLGALHICVCANTVQVTRVQSHHNSRLFETTHTTDMERIGSAVSTS